MPSDPSRFQRLASLFERACDLDPLERESLVALHADEPDLVAEVRRMLAADNAPPLALDAPPLLSPLDAPPSARDEPLVPGYDVLRPIGAGGMGVVYEAEQRSPRRRVALKLVRSGLLTEDLVRRFEFESEVLARLVHPGIAQVYHAGTTDAGEPYFAMEFVEGRPLHEHARALDQRARLHLFASLCDAVHHAHQKGVVHRDLKPSNVLVTAAGSPKVLDFGVSRLTDPAARSATLQTAAGQLVGTLAYMSPEQAAADPSRIDTRSDVYSLGVILFELLSGRLPIDIRTTSLMDALSRVRDDAPTRLGALDPRLRGDLDTITSKALAKDPAARYPSAAELAQDVRRFLADLPIQARPPTTAYQLRMFARRHRAAVVAAAVVLLAFLGAFAAVALALRAALEQRAIAESERTTARAAQAEAEAQALRADQQRAAADAARADAERHADITAAVSNFMHLDLLGAVAPHNQGADARVRDVLDAARAHADERFADRPEIAGAVHASLGNVYNSIGEYPASEAELLKAVDLLSRSLGDRHELTIFAREDLGDLYATLARFDDARPLIQRALDDATAAFGPSDERTLHADATLAELDAAAGLLHAAAERLERLSTQVPASLGHDHTLAWTVRSHLAALHLDLDHPERALELFQAILEHRRATVGEDAAATLIALHNVATTLEALARYEQAEPMYRRVLEIETAHNGPDHPDVLVTQHNLGFLLARIGRHDEAEPMLRDVLERCHRVFGPGHPGTLTSTRSLCTLLLDTDRPAEVLDLAPTAIAAADATIGPDHPAVTSLLFHLARAEFALDRYHDAAASFRRAAEAFTSAHAPDHPQTLKAWLGVARSLERMGDPDAARAVAADAARLTDDPALLADLRAVAPPTP